MKKILPFILLTFFAGRASGQLLIYGTLKYFACAGSDIGIQTSSGYASGYFWQLSMDNGNTWNTLTDNSTYSGSSTGQLSIDNVAVSMTGYLYRYGATSNPTVFSPVDTLDVFATYANTPVFVSPATSVCQGQTIPYIITGDLNDSSYWSVANATNLSSFGGISDTVDMVNFPTAGSATVTAYAFNGCLYLKQASVSVTVNPLQFMPAGTAGGGADCASFYVYPGAASTYSDGTCSPIAAVTSSGSSPVSGLVQSCVTLDASVPSYNGIPYVSRYYNIEPVTNPSTSTATITLYFTQADFDAYNAARGGAPALPTGPSDATGISNLTISQFHGAGTTPDTYVSGSGTIVPSSVVWNSTASRWEVTFSVTGFSGFFVSGASIIPLPLTLTSFTGVSTAAGNQLHWETAMEENTAYFDVQREAVGDSGFQSIATVPAAGNINQPRDYQYLDGNVGGTGAAGGAGAAGGGYSYRLKMADLDGHYTYSGIVTLQSAADGLSIRVSPNPFHQPLVLVVSVPQAGNGNLFLTDVAGNKIGEQAVSLQKGETSLDPVILADLPQGVYFLSILTNQGKQTIKLIKE